MRLVNRPFGLLLLAILSGFVNLHLLFAVVPKYVTTGTAGTVGAGLVTGALMATTVLTQLQVPRLTRKLGYPATLATGLVLLGAPALVLPLSPGLPLVLAVSLLRGLGFGVITVTGSALTAELVPARRRGAGMGAYGIAVGVPGVVALPAGVWLVDRIGYTPIFLIAGLAPLVGLGVALAIRAPAPAEEARRHPVLRGLGSGGLARPFTVLCAATAATGIVKTFLPLAVPATLGALASAALFAQLTAVTVSRAAAGLIGDRVGSNRLLVPGVLATAGGMFGLSATGDPLPLLAGAVIFGVGLGIVQTATLVIMMDRVPRAGYGAASALWNIAFDAGTGVGAVVFGVVARALGFETGFLALAVVLLASAGFALWDRVARPPVAADS